MLRQVLAQQEHRPSYEISWRQLLITYVTILDRKGAGYEIMESTA